MTTGNLHCPACGHLVGRLDLPSDHQTPAARDVADVQRFLAERTRHDVKAATPVRQLYATYRNWCAAEGLPAVPATGFGLRLKALGIPRSRSAQQRVYATVALRDDQDHDAS